MSTMPAPTDELKRNIAWIFRELIANAGWEHVLGHVLPEGTQVRSHVVREQVNVVVFTMPDETERCFEFRVIEHG